MSRWLTAAGILRNNAYLHPGKIGAKDLTRSLTFKQWDERANRLANALMGLGLKKNDRFGVIAFNCVEWMELYATAAKGGFVIVPILFRLTPGEIKHICQHAEIKALFVARDFVQAIDSIRNELEIPQKNYIFFGDEKSPAGYVNYENFIQTGSPRDPMVEVDDEDPWVHIYTSGTTGAPKGVIRSHRSFNAHNLLRIVNFGFRSDDIALLVMPMSHINSIYFSWCFTWIAAGVCIYSRPSFDPEYYLKVMHDEAITFTSLVPTHYVMLLDLPEDVKNRYYNPHMRKLLCSSAPVQKETKIRAMEYWKSAGLYEEYGTTESGAVTLLRPEEQFEKLGTIGREVYGIERVRLLDEYGKEVPDGEVGEICAKTPSMFTEYYKDPQRTEEAFRFGGYFHTGDMAIRREDGYYVLVDRKADMIITGGENVYPSEVEQLLRGHPAVKEVAVIGVADRKWGEAIKAVIVLQSGYEPTEALKEEVIKYCRGKIAGYKIPKSVDFIEADEMPRTATGKILRRKLRERYK